MMMMRIQTLTPITQLTITPMSASLLLGSSTLKRIANDRDLGLPEGNNSTLIALICFTVVCPADVDKEQI